ncbi:MAG: hypothetical protein AUK47_18070 [Deltaproteobacteria bacterium CG2_30_63_29]|nr:MAG: hypothetical protein AUK47_18070 [Deltaproteobacteria bacterium CG2_30_63_29]
MVPLSPSFGPFGSDADVLVGFQQAGATVSTNAKRLRQSLGAVLSFAVGIGLVLAVTAWSGVGSAEVWETLSRAHAGYIVLFGASYLLDCLIVTYRWECVAGQLVSTQGMRGHFLLYTLLTNLVSQLVPPHLSLVIVRPLALRAHRQLAVSKGIVSTIFEMLFDLLVPALVLIPWVGILLFGGGIYIEFLLAFCVLGLGTVVVWRRGLVLAHLVGSARRRLLRMWPSRAAADTESFFVGEDVRGMLRKLWGLSVVRYVNMVLRTCLVLPAFALDIPWDTVAMGVSPVILASYLGPTPASLGVAEAVWVLVLARSGVAASAATTFALAGRALHLFNVVVMAGVGIPWLWLQIRGRLRAQVAKPSVDTRHP